MITTIKSLPLLALLTLASCNDYLDTKPSKGNNEILSTSEQVEALFNNSSMFIQSVSIPAASSDDMGMDMGELGGMDLPDMPDMPDMDMPEADMPEEVPAEGAAG